MSYPRERNGHVDVGKRIGPKERCPNCRSDRYYQTVSREHCPACGLECDYWGGGSNEVYDRMMRNQQAEEALRERERQIQWEIDNGWRD